MSTVQDIDRLSFQIGEAAKRDVGAYLKEVSKARRHFRVQTIVHLIVNIRRYPVRLFPGIIKWVLIRLCWILRLTLVRDKDPYAVYRGPGS